MYMVGMRKFKIGLHERGFLFWENEFKAMLDPGRHWFADPFFRIRVDIVSVREARIKHKDLDVIIRSGALKNQAEIVDLQDHERALVWIDGRFDSVLQPGLYALWKVFRGVKIETVNANDLRFHRNDLAVVARGTGAAEALEAYTVEAGSVGLFFKEGVYQATLNPGTHAFWKGVAKVKLHHVDLREQIADIAGQEIMTADKVTLRLNALVTYRVADPLKSVTVVDDFRQALYREAQLALRAVIGTRELDVLLTDKDTWRRNLKALSRTAPRRSAWRSSRLASATSSCRAR